MSTTALSRAIDAAGSQSALAKMIGVRQSVLWYWLTGSKKGVPAEYCAAIEAVTGVRKDELRPDVFASPDSEVAA